MREWVYITTKFADVEFISDDLRAADAFERLATHRGEEPKRRVLIEKTAYNSLKRGFELCVQTLRRLRTQRESLKTQLFNEKRKTHAKEKA